MRINDIFRSINGETNIFHQGSWATFIRFQGCNLKCSWCDTPQAQDPEGGTEMSLGQIITEVDRLGCKRITITGGEPLFQTLDFFDLTKALFNKNYGLSVETNGSFPLYGLAVSSWVVDYKLCSSGMSGEMDLTIFGSLAPKDYIKLVVKNHTDFMMAMEVIKTYNRNASGPTFVFSPITECLDSNQLFAWIDNEKLFDTILSVQLHKIIGVK